ncbi:phage head-tail joining protein [Paracoccus methylarcula]|uniref:Uncharacterized protein n=1 Tax=Paracoccus methylarcula TaxID=72022 RepID=A0A3R7NAW9_9RHOB|nr:hypothetical protein [Paracoccus methylarcula]RNF33715.1 hypothetical protein A7A09_014590 [Paracoccus methylarcula]
MATLAELQAYRERLLETRYSGIRSLTDQNGEQVHYRSQSEIERAIAALDAEIAALTSGRSNRIKPIMTKGLEP